MTEENKPEFRHEGQPAFIPDTENENSESADEKTDKENETDGASSETDEEEKSQDSDGKPLNEHPRWKAREQEWNDKFAAQADEHKKAIDDLRAEFGTKRQENADQTKIPSWFGGDQAQWDAYRADRDAELVAAEERAAERITKKSEEQNKAVKDATDFMKSELEVIQADKVLNPTGGKIDPNKLLKIVIDNDLVDSKGRWNYRAGMKIYGQTKTGPSVRDRKEIVAATNSDAKGETKASTFKTSADFKKPGARPW
jgi:hypothetical protein